jgi:hypothetical protein
MCLHPVGRKDLNWRWRQSHVNCFTGSYWQLKIGCHEYNSLGPRRSHVVHLKAPLNASKSNFWNGPNTPVPVPNTNENVLWHQKLPTALSRKPTNCNVHTLAIYIHLDPDHLQENCLIFHKILYKFPSKSHISYNLNHFVTHLKITCVRSVIYYAHNYIISSSLNYTLTISISVHFLTRKS